MRVPPSHTESVAYLPVALPVFLFVLLCCFVRRVSFFRWVQRQDTEGEAKAQYGVAEDAAELPMPPYASKHNGAQYAAIPPSEIAAAGPADAPQDAAITVAAPPGRNNSTDMKTPLIRKNA